MKTKLGAGGRLVIPASFRKELGLRPGDEVLITLDNNELKVVSARQAVFRAQNIVRQYIPKERILSAELIRERREEASSE